MILRATIVLMLAASLLGAGEPARASDLASSAAREALAASRTLFDQLVAGTIVGLTTDEWVGIDLLGRPMDRSGLEDPPAEESPRVWRGRDHFYDQIEILDQDVRVYGPQESVAVVRSHAVFTVTSNGEKLRVELRVLDVFERQGGRWLLDLTQATPVGRPEVPSE